MDVPIGQWWVSERQEPPGNKQWGGYVPQRWCLFLTTCFDQSRHHLLPAPLPTASCLACLLLLLPSIIYFPYHSQNNSFYLCCYYLFFNWRQIALQCCVGFCRATVRFSHNYTYVTSLPSPYPTLLGHHRPPGWAPCAIQQLLTSYLFGTW